mmetsp:Transcript_31167/g.50218  ORF Transcript_31167/g.50218 Transcript_31167/m.50218 type:complete len:134 (+) Transcript_31167:63-464(+)
MRQWDQEPEASALGSKEVLQRAGSNEWSRSPRPSIFSRNLWRAPDPTLSSCLSCLPGATLDSPEALTKSDGSAKQMWPPHEEIRRDEVCEDCSGSDDESDQIFKEYALGQLQIWIKTTVERSRAALAFSQAEA